MHVVPLEDAAAGLIPSPCGSAGPWVLKCPFAAKSISQNVPEMAGGLYRTPCLSGKPMVSCFPLSQSIDFTINAGAAQELGHPLSRQGGCSEDPFRGQSQIIFFACRWHARCVVWWCFYVFRGLTPKIQWLIIIMFTVWMAIYGNCGVYTMLNESCSNTHTHPYCMSKRRNL